MFIGKIDVRAREKILVTIKDVKKTRMIDVRVHHTVDGGNGGYARRYLAIRGSDRSGY